MEFLEYIGSALVYTGYFLLAGVLPWIIFALITHKISDSLRKSLASILSLKGYIFLTAPGVMIHELSHAFFCLIFRHKIIEMKLFSPQSDGTLGYVQHQYDPQSLYQRCGNFFIGTGPVWGGVVLLCLLSSKLLPPFEEDYASVMSLFTTSAFWLSFKSWIWLYLTLTILSHITLSGPDLKGAFDGGIAIVTAVLLLFVLFGWCGEWESELIDNSKNLFFSFMPLLILFLLLSGTAAVIFRIFRK